MRSLLTALLLWSAAAGAAAAQPADQPAGPGAPASLGGARFTYANVTIVNHTPYPIFTETLNGGLKCVTNGYPAATIQPGRSLTHTLRMNCTGQGYQVFVPAMPGPERRPQLGFSLPQQFDNIGQVDLGYADDGEFYVLAGGLRMDASRDGDLHVVGNYYFNWEIRCRTLAGC